jgi:PEP-CTERM motif
MGEKMILMLLAMLVTWQDVQEIPAFETEGQGLVDFHITNPDEGLDLEGKTTRELISAEISWDIDLGTVAIARFTGVIADEYGRYHYDPQSVEYMGPAGGRFTWNSEMESPESESDYWFLFHTNLKLELEALPISSDPLEFGPIIVLGGTITTTYVYEDGLPETDPTPEVPEPATALLLGLGLAAVATRSAAGRPTPDVPGQAAGRFSR